MKQHSPLSPSASKRWINCSGSILLPDSGIKRDTTAADEGTLAHKMAELKLTRDIWNDNEDELEECRNDPLYKPEMDDYTTGYVNFINSFNVEDRAIELVVNLKRYAYDLFGTCDCVLFDHEHKKLYVIDFKYGFGKVEAQNNSQLRIYALGAIEHFINRSTEPLLDDFEVEMFIYQPRIKNISSETLKVSELKDWYFEQVQPAVDKIHNFDLELNSGDWCKFCNKHIHCQLYNQELLAEEEGYYNESFSKLSNKEIVDYFEKFKEIESHINEIKSYLIKQIEDGKTIPGYKLSKSHTRSWNKSEELNELLKEFDLYNPMTVAQTERKLGKEKFDELFSDYISTKESGSRLLKVNK